MEKNPITNGLLKSLSGCMIHCAQHGLTDEAQIIGAVIRLIQNGHASKLAIVLRTINDPTHTQEQKKEAFIQIHKIMGYESRQYKRKLKAQAPVSNQDNIKPAK